VIYVILPLLPIIIECGKVTPARNFTQRGVNELLNFFVPRENKIHPAAEARRLF
jgi:hypothetical protein